MNDGRGRADAPVPIGGTPHVGDPLVRYFCLDVQHRDAPHLVWGDHQW